MNYRNFGTTDLRVSELGLGCSWLGAVTHETSDEKARRTIDLAYDNGVNFYDTADSYGQGRSEILLGNAFRQKRHSVVIASKAGYCLSQTGSLLARLRPVLRPVVRVMPQIKKKARSARLALTRQDFSPSYVRRAIENSLLRLHTDYLDLFQLHSPPVALPETGELFATLEELKQEGKIRYYGVSCRTVEDAQVWVGYDHLSSIQVEINLMNHTSVLDLLDVAGARHLAVIAREPLASGLLARPIATECTEQELDTRTPKAEQWRFLTACGRSIPQAALQFVLQLSGPSVVIVGTANPDHLAHNLQVLTLPKLSDAERNEIRRVASASESLALEC